MHVVQRTGVCICVHAFVVVSGAVYSDLWSYKFASDRGLVVQDSNLDDCGYLPLHTCVKRQGRALQRALRLSQEDREAFCYMKFTVQNLALPVPASSDLDMLSEFTVFSLRYLWQACGLLMVARMEGCVLKSQQVKHHPLDVSRSNN
jgi:hypothetical protein